MSDDITHQQILDAIGGTEVRLTSLFHEELATTKAELIEGITEQLDVITENMVTKADLRAIGQI